MTARKLTAFTVKGTASPRATISAPASAGPRARLTFMPMELSATAALSCSRGTRWGRIDCQVGAMKAIPAPSRKTKRSRSGALIAPAATSNASVPATTSIRVLTRRSSRRRSTTSASAPAGSASRNMGRVVAACTRATHRGSGAMVAISQPAPTSFIQVPRLEITIAPQSTAKARWPRGDQGPAWDGEGWERGPSAGRRGSEGDMVGPAGGGSGAESIPPAAAPLPGGGGTPGRGTPPRRADPGASSGRPGRRTRGPCSAMKTGPSPPPAPHPACFFSR